MGAQNFNFAPKFHQIGGGGFIPNFARLDENYPTRREFADSFSTAQNLAGEAIAPPPSPCHDAIVPFRFRGVSTLNLSIRPEDQKHTLKQTEQKSAVI